MKKVLFSLMTLMVVTGLVGGGAFAYFSDTETSKANTFTAGTLDLLVDQDPSGSVDAYVNNPDFSAAVSAAASNLKPGDSQSLTIGIKNDGTIAGIPTINLTDIVNDDNGLTDPEGDVDTTGGVNGLGQGELGQYVKVRVQYDNGSILYDDTVNNFHQLVGASLNSKATSEWDITVYIPTTVGNIIQSDSVSFKVVFGLWQDNAEALVGSAINTVNP